MELVVWGAAVVCDFHAVKPGHSVGALVLELETPPTHVSGLLGSSATPTTLADPVDPGDPADTAEIGVAGWVACVGLIGGEVGAEVGAEFGAEVGAEVGAEAGGEIGVEAVVTASVELQTAGGSAIG